jgi:hypothetical protein
MRKEQFNRAKEIECGISYLKSEIDAIDKITKDFDVELMNVKTKRYPHLVLRNCYGMFNKYFKKYRNDLEIAISELEKEFEEL